MRAQLARQIGSWLFVAATVGGFGVFGPRAAAAAEWRSLGPDGGSILALAADPSDARVLYAATSGGLFRSGNGGRRWSAIGNALVATPTALATDPLGSHVLLVGTDRGIYRSFDAGTTLVRSASGLSSGLTVLALRFSPGRRGDVLALGGTFTPLGGPASPPFEVARSLDGGGTWRKVGAGLPADATWNDLAPDLFATDTWYLATSRGLYRSRDDGSSWRVISRAGRFVQSVAPDPRRAGRVWALETQLASGSPDPRSVKLLLSTDGGFHWQEREPNGQPGQLTRLALDPARRDHVYTATPAALWFSADAGRTWRRALDRSVTALVGDRATGTLTAALVETAVARSLDGATWTALPALGLRARVLTAVAAGGGGALWALDFTNRTWTTRDEGATWSSSAPLGGAFDYATMLIADPESADAAYLASAVGLRRTRDGGATWQPAGPTAPGAASAVYALAMDPAESQRLYLAELTSLFRSDDGGDHWQTLAPLYPFRSPPQVLTVAPGTPPTLLADAPYPISPHPHDQVNRSTDEGATWSLLVSAPKVTAIVVDPQDSLRMWVAYAHYDYLGPIVAGGIHYSTDGGANWSLAFVAPSAPPVIGLVLDPNDAAGLYAATSRDVFVSHDGGANWRSLAPGLRGTQVLALAVRPGAPSTLYAATTGGVFALALDGAAD